jgi:hypothetical protein
VREGDANYLNQVQKDRYGNALEIFQDDPIAGMKQMSSAVGPEQTNDWYQKYVAGRNAADQNKTQAQRVASQNAEDTDKRDNLTYERLAGLFRTANASNWDQVVATAKDIAARRGYDISQLHVPEKFTEGWSGTITERGLAPKESVTAGETYRHNTTTEADKDADRVVTANLGKARVLASLAGQSQGTYRTERRIGQQVAAETGKNNRASANRELQRERMVNSVVARINKDNPGARIQKNSVTGKVRYSTDGGRTWNQAN